MAAETPAEPLPPAIEKSPIAGFWRRLAAFLVDGLILGVPALLLGLVTFQWAASLGQAGRLIGFFVALLYFGLLNSQLGGGRTLGKRLMGIRVIDRSGNPLSPKRSVLRYLILAIPYFLNGLWFDVNAQSVGVAEFLLGALLIFLVLGGLGAIVYLLVFNRRTRQSLHDLVVGSFVVRGSPAPVPSSLATPRLHLIVVGCWLAVTLIGPSIAYWLVRDSSLVASLSPLAELQAAIRTQVGARQVKVSAGSTMFASVGGGTSTTSFLQVEAQPGYGRADLDTLVLAIARKVLDLHPDLLGKQALIIRVRYGFDFGIAGWSHDRQEAFNAAAWRQKLRRFRPRPSNI